jgi:plastocyanin
LAAGLLCALAALLFIPSHARAGVNGQCPPIADKAGAIPHVGYDGVQHLTYCYGPISIKPGQNIIRFNPAKDPNGTKLFPQVPGYITRFDPELVYADGKVPGVDVLHLHHAVWVVNFNPQFAAGEEKTILQLPQGFGWRSNPSDNWLLNDMLHELVAAPATVYLVWRLDFVPDTAPGAAFIKPVTTKWMDVAGIKAYPVFNALRGEGQNGRYTFPDQTPPSDQHLIGPAQSWTPNHPVTLIGTAGHLHPGGLQTQLRVNRGFGTNSIFTSKAHYYEPAGEVSWDVSMGASPTAWRVKLQAGDKLSVHATYDTSRADWYEVMGIMPVTVYNGTDVGGFDAMSPNIPQQEVLTHGHLHENDNHGGAATNAPDPLALPGYPTPNGTVSISGFSYLGAPTAGSSVSTTSGSSVPTIEPGQSRTFKNLDAVPSINAFHTITACKAPCNQSTGIAYPIANGPVSFDSGELGFNGNNGSIGGAPASGRDTWKTPDNLAPGTYTYFCRIHPFMRGSFRVQPPSSCAGAQPTIIGTDGPDVIRGTKGRDVIVGLGGNDKIIGLSGKDSICGGPGNDTIIGGSGSDTLFGATGRDKLMGGPGTDKLMGGPGKDRLIGGLGKDRLIGGPGQDRLIGVSGKDREKQ